MKLEYNLTRVDLYEFYKFDAWYSPDKKKLRIRRYFINILFPLILPFVFHSTAGHDYNSKIILNLFFIGFFLAFIGAFFTSRFVTSRMEYAVDKLLEGKNQDLMGAQTMEFSNENFTCKSENSESVIKYQMLEKLREDENYYFLYINSISAYIIPKRVFASDKEMLDLKELIKNWC